MKFKNKKEKALYILEEMAKLFPEGIKSEIVEWETPFQFLICVIVSPQTTDVSINKVMPKLWEHYPDAQSLANADIEHVQELIGSLNYYRNKSKYIVQSSSILVEKYGGKVPKDEKSLLELPGVGKKVANVYLNDMFELNNGIGVDTHILRISNRLGLTKETTPDKVALDLQALYEQALWHRVNSLFVLYGRYYCKANIKPENSKCVFEFCGHCSAK